MCIYFVFNFVYLFNELLAAACLVVKVNHFFPIIQSFTCTYKHFLNVHGPCYEETSIQNVSLI